MNSNRKKQILNEYDWNDDNQSSKTEFLRRCVNNKILFNIHGNLPPPPAPTQKSSEEKFQIDVNKNQNYIQGNDVFIPNSEREFDKFIQKHQGPIVIDFYAKWLSDAIKREDGQIKVIRVNVGMLGEIANKYNISLAPTAVGIGCDGQVIDNKLTGATCQEDVDRFVRQIIDTCNDSKKRVRSASESKWRSDWLLNEQNKAALKLPYNKELKKNEEIDKLLTTSKSPLILQFQTNALGDLLASSHVAFDILRVNIAKFPNIASLYNVNKIPTVLALDERGSPLTQRLSGCSSPDEIFNFVQRLVTKHSSDYESIIGDRYDPDLAFPLPLQIQSYKHQIFTNDVINLKPVSMIPGIGHAYAERMRKQGLIHARQLVGVFMQTGNIPQFQHWLKEQFGMNERWSRTAAESLAEVVRHLC